MARGNSIARHIPAGYFTTQQVADIVKVSRDTVKRWRDNGHFPPDDEVTIGDLKIPVYLPRKIALARALKTGLGTLAERAEAFKEAG